MRLIPPITRVACRALGVLSAFCLACIARCNAVAEEDLALVPWPKSVQRSEGFLSLAAEVRVVHPDETTRLAAEIVAEELSRVTGVDARTVLDSPRPGDVVVGLEAAHVRARDDEYRLDVNDRVTLTGTTPRSLALGTSTLVQLVQVRDGQATWPCVTIQDWADLAYNGTLLDVARKPYSIEVLRQCVRVCHYYKIRYLLLHLSDENAWTFPSTRYPQLGSQNFAWAGGPAPRAYDLAALQDLVAFADARGVTIVPEMEVPGHSGQLRGTLPEVFGYRNERGETLSLGVINMAREEAYEVLSTLVGEMCDVFRSSPYFHIGCDEASLGGINDAAEAREFARQNQLEQPEDIFNAFVHRMHAIVKSHGKRMIVWEGAPTGPKPLPSDVIFMPWVGGSDAALHLIRAGHQVINAPWGVEQPYFDPYCVNAAQLERGEPLLLGATSLLWQSEAEKALDFLRFTGALRNEPTYFTRSERNYDDFLARWQETGSRLDRLLYGFSMHELGTMDVRLEQSPTKVFADPATLTLEPPHAAGVVRFTLDGTEPVGVSPEWCEPLRLTQTTLLKARWFPAEGSAGDVFSREFRRLRRIEHDAIGAAVTVSDSRPGYSGPGAKGLTDGFLAAGNDYDKPGWVGWANRGTPLSITLDLGRSLPIERCAAHLLRAGGGVGLAQAIEFAISDDGLQFLPGIQVDQEVGLRQRGWYAADLGGAHARYVRATIAHGADWTFVDEFAVSGQPVDDSVSHAARGKNVTLAFEPHAYTAPGIQGLTDAQVSEEPNFLSLEWLGFETHPFEATLDLGETTAVERVGARFLEDAQGGIFVPQSLTILASTDGTEFRQVGLWQRPSDPRGRSIASILVPLVDVRTRYLKLVAHPAGPWIFVDEILVDPAPK